MSGQTILCSIDCIHHCPAKNRHGICNLSGLHEIPATAFYLKASFLGLPEFMPALCFDKREILAGRDIPIKMFIGVFFIRLFPGADVRGNSLVGSRRNNAA